jgi:DNA-binding LacI/PurR family transcriptional regulator
VANERQTKTTLKVVARRAGVSTSTASLVFSGRGPVASATAERVRAAAKELGYAGPDPLASSLRHGRSGVVGVLVEGRLLHAFRDPFAVSLLDGLAGVLDGIPTGMLLIAQPDGNPQRTVEQVAGMALDAVVFSLCGPSDNPVVEHCAARGIPMVGTGTPVDPRVVQVSVDDRGAMAGLVRYLHHLGHHRIAHITMDTGPWAATGPTTRAAIEQADYPITRDRALGVLDEHPDATLVQAAEADVDQGAAAARLLLQGVSPSERPTAIVAQSDLLAVGAIRAAHELGVRVPEDLSVTGFDGVPLPWFDGTLTTVMQHGDAKGRRVGEAVRAVLAGGPPPESVTLPTELRVGTTTAPPP